MTQPLLPEEQSERGRVLDALLVAARQEEGAGRDELAELLLDARWILRAEPQADAVSPLALEELRHRAQLDRYRLMVALVLIGVLFAVITIGLIRGADGDAVSQFAAPISGLAGIAVGWIFGGHRSGS